MKWNIYLTTIAVLIVSLFVAFGYVHRSELVLLTPQGAIAMEEREIIGITILLASFVVVPVFFLLGIFIWKYRFNNPHAVRKHTPDWDHDNWIMEMFWWSIPALIILLLSLVIWRSSHELDPYKPIEGYGAPLTVEVVSLNWKWLFIYPEQGIATVNMVEIPVGRPVRFILTSDAPMNSFWVPSLAGQIMTMPGMKTELNLIASTEGEYAGSSGNISGEGFAGMRFNTVVVSPSEFETWVQSVKGGSAILTHAEYESLALPSKNVAPTFYSEVSANLFDTIVMRSMMSGMDMRMPIDMKEMEVHSFNDVTEATTTHRKIITQPI